jgi:GNAT superfamily N-acetyltransferase
LIAGTWGSPYLAAQAAWLQHLGSAPGAEVSGGEGLYAVRTRVTSNSENGVLADATAPVTCAQAERLAAWFAEWRVPSSWLCAERGDHGAVAAKLEAAGYRPERSAWEMRASVGALAALPAVALPGVRLAPVSSERTLGAWLDVAGAGGWFESEAAVGMASAFFTEKTVVLTSVSVLPSERRRGIGRALALERLREARERGCELAVLGSSPDGAALYETLGFESHPQPPDRWFYAPFAV